MPSGARVGSTTEGCTVMRNGASGARFSRDAARRAAPISALSAPICTVPALRASGAVHGTGPSSA
ncbi:hypothetical protein GCM10019016_083650 [Streptomyces prasinosporus]|uniref:Uncharacterized protein n=1 Tax=Streptomyces prasinosporus TaxID=68256 RepID=A0ABP6U0S2_9ACTN